MEEGVNSVEISRQKKLQLRFRRECLVNFMGTEENSYDDISNYMKSDCGLNYSIVFIEITQVGVAAL